MHSEKLVLDLMMFGRVKRKRIKRDENGNKVILRMTTDNKPVYKYENIWEVTSKENGDKGLFPSVNNIFIFSKKGGSYTKMARALNTKWKQDIKAWAAANNWEPVQEKVYVDYFFYLPNDNIKRDTHNVLKMNLDCMSGVIFADDDLALPRIMNFEKCGDGEPRIEIRFMKKKDFDEMIEK